MTTLEIQVPTESQEDIYLAKEIRNEIRNAKLEGVMILHKPKNKPTTQEGVTPSWGPDDLTAIPVDLLASGGVIVTIINIVLSKLTRDRSVTLEIDGDKITVTGINSDEQKRLIDLWLNKHQRQSRKNAR